MPSKVLRQGPRDRDFPDLDRSGRYGVRKAVCRSCGLPMVDCEPSTWGGDFYHIAKPHHTRARRCKNEGKAFVMWDSELVPFMPKARRRALKRMGIRA